MFRWQTRAANGWLDFPKKDSEQLSEWHSKGQVAGTLVIDVKGKPMEYLIDFNKMTNTAVSTGRERQIRKPYEKGARLHTTPRNPKGRAKVGNPIKSEKGAAKSSSSGASPESPKNAPPSVPTHATMESDVNRSLDVRAAPPTLPFQDKAEILSFGDREAPPSSPARITEVEPSISVRAASPIRFPHDESEIKLPGDRNSAPSSPAHIMEVEQSISVRAASAIRFPQEEAAIKLFGDRNSPPSSPAHIMDVKPSINVRDASPIRFSQDESENRLFGDRIAPPPTTLFEDEAEIKPVGDRKSASDSIPKIETVSWTEKDQEMTNTLRALTPSDRERSTIVPKNPEFSLDLPADMTILGMSRLTEEIPDKSMKKSKNSTYSDDANSHANRDTLTQMDMDMEVIPPQLTLPLISKRGVVPVKPEEEDDDEEDEEPKPDSNGGAESSAAANIAALARAAAEADDDELESEGEGSVNMLATHLSDIMEESERDLTVSRSSKNVSKRKFDFGKPREHLAPFLQSPGNASTAPSSPPIDFHMSEPSSTRRNEGMPPDQQLMDGSGTAKKPATKSVDPEKPAKKPFCCF